MRRAVSCNRLQGSTMSPNDNRTTLEVVGRSTLQVLAFVYPDVSILEILLFAPLAADVARLLREKMAKWWNSRRQDSTS